jgi:HD-GYP domain-containing protein (c-di-GMP phosphodiesterase class II)
MMSLDPNLEEQELLADTLQRDGTSVTALERITEGLVAVAFGLAVAGLWILDPPHSFAVWPAAVCLVVLALATRVRFDTPLGFTVPTQLAFVPLLFAMPVVLVPVGVVLALLIARLPDVVAGTCKPSRLLLTVSNSWFAVGPVAVFALAETAPRDAGALLLLGALAAQISVDFAVSSFRFGIVRGVGIAEQLRETWVYAIDATLATIGLTIAEELHAQPVVAFAPLPLLALLGVLARERRQRLAGMLELNNAYRGTALVLGDVVEADDGYTGMHCKSVVALALGVGEALHLGAERRRNLEFASLLHDVGKIAIPKEIINKPGKLDPDEWVLVRTHTLEGQKLLDRVGGFMREVGVIIRSHHERWDGGGYPDGLAGDRIPLEACIIACCDSWNAMRTDRPYRKALSYQAARAELEANAGLQFAPGVVQTLLDILAATDPEPQGAHVDPASAAPVQPSAGSADAGDSLLAPEAPDTESRSPRHPSVRSRRVAGESRGAAAEVLDVNNY